MSCLTLGWESEGHRIDKRGYQLKAYRTCESSGLEVKTIKPEGGGWHLGSLRELKQNYEG